MTVTVTVTVASGRIGGDSVGGSCDATGGSVGGIGGSGGNDSDSDSGDSGGGGERCGEATVRRLV